VGTAIGGSVGGSHGLVLTVGATTPVTIGSAKGGSIAGAFGVSGAAGTTIILNGTDLSGTGYPVATLGMLKVAPGVVLQFSDSSGALLPFYSGVVSANYVLTGHTNYTDGTPGTVVLPAAGDVRSGTTFGSGGGTTGTLNVNGQARVIGG
jgi:hypothetical protein